MMFTDGGSVGLISSSAAFTRSETATVFVPGWRMTASTMARSPLYQLAFLLFWTSSLTVPRSLRCTGAPFRFATTIERNWSAFESWPVAWIVSVRSFPYSTPVGRMTLLLRTAVAMSLTLKPRVVSCAGSSWTRTAYFADPNTLTCDTPSTCDRRCAIVVSATSSSAVSDIEFDVSAKKRIGDAAGFCLRYDGGMIVDGRNASAPEIAALTSCAAASMSRSGENCSVTFVFPMPLLDVMLSMPAMAENAFSSGVATVAAIVSGLAPGRFALTLIVG